MVYGLARSTETAAQPDGSADGAAAAARLAAGTAGKAALREVCDRLAEGWVLQRICADPRLPDLAALARTLGRSATFRKHYDVARRFQADLLMDEMRLIADGETGDTEDECTGQDLQRDKLRIDTRKWLVDRLLTEAVAWQREAPAKDGDKTTVLVTKFADEPADPPAP
jgi:hypothetical protein